MKRNYFFMLFLLMITGILGCGLLSNDDDDELSAPQTTTITGKVEFPESAGTVGSIRGSIKGKVDLTNYRIWINDIRFVLHDDGTYTAQLTVADEYDIQVRFAGSNNAILRAIATPDSTTGGVPVNILSTAISLAYIAYTSQAGQSANFQTFEELVDEADEVIQELAVAIETALQSVENLESEDFNLEDDENVQAKTDDAVEKAEEEEEKLASGTTTTTTSTTSTTAEVDTTTTTSSTTTTTAVELPDGTLAINDGAATTETVNVILNLTVTQAMGVITMSVNGGEFEPLNMAKSHTLSEGDGEKTVTIILKDDNGESKEITDTITLETPKPVEPVKMASAGMSHALFIKDDKTVWGIGSNQMGQLAMEETGENASSSVLVKVSGLSDVVAVAVGGIHSLALKTDGTVWAWGSNMFGQLGNGEDGDETPITTPFKIANLSGIKAIAAGFAHNLALDSDGAVWTWGLQGNDMFAPDASIKIRNTIRAEVPIDGEMDPTIISTPVKIEGPGTVQAIAAGDFMSLILASDGDVWTWGNPGFFALMMMVSIKEIPDGIRAENGGIPIPPLEPTKITGLTDVKEIIAGGLHALALKTDGTVMVWGDNSMGQHGAGNTSSPESLTAAVPVPGLSGIMEISAGLGHTLVQKEDGTLLGWGLNEMGQLPIEGEFDNTTPTVIPITDVESFAAGGLFSVFLKKDGTHALSGSTDIDDIFNGL
ncbi:RCC1 domain-containing protein [Candidatus Riflebacteria bacterium]